MNSPRDLGLSFDKWRPGQPVALYEIAHGRRHTVINAPTGLGKSLLAAASILMRPDWRHVIATVSRELQRQYQTEFPFLADLRGIQNYPAYGDRCLTCRKGPCEFGDRSLTEGLCDYYDARMAFTNAQAGLTNYPMWFMAASYLAPVDRLILDEAHDLPEALIAAESVELPQRYLPHEDEYAGWKADQWKRHCEGVAQQLKGKTNGSSDAARHNKLLLGGVKRLATDLTNESWAWQYDDYTSRMRFEPVIPAELMSKLSAREQIVYLSATHTERMYTDVLGIDPDELTYHEIEQRFPRENSPVYLLGGVHNHWHMSDWQRQRMIGLIDTLIAPRVERKGLIHTVAYDRARDIYEGSEFRDQMLLHTRQHSGGEIRRMFEASPAGTILVSPSMDTGVSFPDDQCRYQIVAKMPLRKKGPILKARIRRTPTYEQHYVMQKFIQMCGRIVRSSSDWGETFLIDEIGRDFYVDHQEKAPEWFHQIVIDTADPHIEPM